MAKPFTDPLPPGPLESTNTRDWLYRLARTVSELGSQQTNLVQIVNPPPISFTDDVPLVMSNTTSAELVYRFLTKSITLANGLVDLLAMNVLTKFAKFAGAASFAGNVTVLSGGMNIAGELIVSSGGASVTSDLNVHGAMSADGNIFAGVNFNVNDGQGLVLNADNPVSVVSFIRHINAGVEIWAHGTRVLLLKDSGGGFAIAAPASNSASAGVAFALPSAPAGYIEFDLIGFGTYKIPVFNL